jgi:hypothetical protein
MTEKPRRRRLRFGLRTLLVVMTVVCCWLAWESNVVRERRATRQELSAKGFHFVAADEYATFLPPALPGGGKPRVAKIPRVRAWLGDEAIQEVWYYAHGTGGLEAELERLKRVFPEAEISETVPEPCHPGCFPRATLVDTPRGPRPIQTIEVGDVITTIGTDGERATATVRSIFVTNNELWRVETENGELLTTQTQPLCLAADTTLQVGKLQPGENVVRYRDGALYSEGVLSARSTGRVDQVFNLIFDTSEIFVADGYLARSKPPAEPAPP